MLGSYNESHLMKLCFLTVLGITDSGNHIPAAPWTGFYVIGSKSRVLCNTNISTPSNECSTIFVF